MTEHDELVAKVAGDRQHTGIGCRQPQRPVREPHQCAFGEIEILALVAAGGVP